MAAQVEATESDPVAVAMDLAAAEMDPAAVDREAADREAVLVADRRLRMAESAAQSRRRPLSCSQPRASERARKKMRRRLLSLRWPRATKRAHQISVP
jgi:hypothetical protein